MTRYTRASLVSTKATQRRAGKAFSSSVESRLKSPSILQHSTRKQKKNDEYMRSRPVTPTPNISDAYQADDEYVAKERRFSFRYGHGNPLGSLQMPTPEPTLSVSSMTRKRKSPASMGSSSSKKVRFSPSLDEKGPAFKRESRCLSAGPTETAQLEQQEHAICYPKCCLTCQSTHQQPPSYGDSHLLGSLIQHPQTLSISQISALFRLLQEETEQFARRWFGQDDTDRLLSTSACKESFPIHNLEFHHPALYWTITNTLDASATDGVSPGWLKFLLLPEYCQFLVYGILGEWLTQRVFKDTSFGLSQAGRQQVESNVDIPYLNFDGFIRAKMRGSIVKHSTNAENIKEHLTSLKVASLKLTDELITLLAPLLPNPDSHIHDDSQKSQLEADWMPLLKHDLFQIVQKCAALNLSIVRTGENGTIIRIAPRVKNGRVVTPYASVQCVNQDVVEMNSIPGHKENLVVKMTCWPRIEAYVPHGMDMLEMNELQKQCLSKYETRIESKELLLEFDADERASDRTECEEINDGFCWDCSGAEKLWDVLPKDLWPDATRKRAKEGLVFVNTDKLKQDHCMKRNKTLRRSTSDGDDNVKSSSSHSDSLGDKFTPISQTWDGAADQLDCFGTHCRSEVKDHEHEPLRGSWVTFYDCIAPHIVYCEWAKPTLEYEKEIEDKGVDLGGRTIKEFNGLPATVQKARRDLNSISINYEDAGLGLHNFYVSNNLWIEWGGVLALTLYFFHGRDILTSTSDNLAHLMNGDFSSIKHCCESISTVSQGLRFSLDEHLNQLAQLLSNFQHFEIDNFSCFSASSLVRRLNTTKDKLNGILAVLSSLLPQPTPSSSSTTSTVDTEDISYHFKAAVLAPFAVAAGLFSKSFDNAQASSSVEVSQKSRAVPTATFLRLSEPQNTGLQQGWLDQFIHRQQG